MRIIFVAILIFFSNSILSIGNDSAFNFYSLRLVGMERFQDANFNVYVFKGIKNNNNDNLVIVFTDSLQNSPFLNINLKTRELVIGQVYNICLKELYYFDWPEDDSLIRNVGFRGMNLYWYKNRCGDVFISNDIQNGRILKRKRKDTLDYFKRKPIYLHGYGVYPG